MYYLIEMINFLLLMNRIRTSKSDPDPGKKIVWIRNTACQKNIRVNTKAGYSLKNAIFSKLEITNSKLLCIGKH